MATIALDRVRVATERAPFVEALFFATVFTVTFAKLQWEVAGTMSFSDVITFVFLIAFAVHRIERFDGSFPRAAMVTLAFFVAFLLVYLIGWFNLETAESLAQWAKGMIKFLLHFLFLIAGVALIARRGMRFYWLTLAAFVGGLAANGAYGLAQLAVAETTGANLDESWLQPLTGGASQINIFGAIEGSFVYRVNALTGDPNHLGIEVAAGILLLLPIYLRLERGHRLRVPHRAASRLPRDRRPRDALAQRAARPRLRLPRAGGPVSQGARSSRSSSSRSGSCSPGLAVFVAQRADFFSEVLSSRLSTEGRGADTHFIVYSFIPDVLAQNPLFGLGLNTFSVYYEFQTGKTNFGPHSFYVASFVEYGLVGTLLFAAFLIYLFRRAGLTRRIGRMLAAEGDPLAARIRPLGWGLTAALVSTMVSNVFYLTMSFYYFYVLALLDDRGARRARPSPRSAPVKVVVLTTSYPRHAGDVAGTFVRDGVEALRAVGVEVRVVSPASFRHYGIAYGDGIVNNLRATPWKVLALPFFLLAFARAARRAARGADSSTRTGSHLRFRRSSTGKPLVLQLWGSDVGSRPARAAARAVAGSSGEGRRVRLDRACRRCPRLGARDVRVIPSGVAIPESVGEPDEPPHVLYVGRLSEEKGVRELAEAARGLPLVVVGDGPLRSLFPQAVGFVPPSELGPYYERAAVVVVPSRREGYGVVAREAMAYGRPVDGDGGRRAGRRGRGRRDGAPRAPGRRSQRSVRRCSAFSRMQSSVERSARPRPESPASASRSRRPGGRPSSSTTS